MITVNANTSRANKKLKELERSILAKGSATVNELVQLGINFAKREVPKDSNTTFRSIKGKTNKRQKGADGQIYIEQRTVPDKRPRVNSRPRTTHDLAFFMAKGLSGADRGAGYGHFKTGDPRFMDSTKAYLNSIKKRIGDKNIKGG